MKLNRAVLVVWAFAATFGFMVALWSRSHLYRTIEVVRKDPNVKYVLHWTPTDSVIDQYLVNGNKTFYQKKCPVKNCFVTSNRDLLNYNISAFDVILLHGPNILSNKNLDVPSERSVKQSYIFASMESSAYYPVSDARYNNVFNFTWTYKINSDIRYGYMVVKDHKGRVIGPNVDIPWIKVEDMISINDSVKEKLDNKNTAVAWFVSNCNSPSKREELAAKIKKELEKYNMNVDVYGACGSKSCSRSSMDECLQKLQKDYYFYLAFENSMAEDYVTEKLLHALQNYAVPIVYGGANYTRFMPDGIYLDAGRMSHIELAKTIVEIIQNKSKYYNFFKWHTYYSYHRPEDMVQTNPYCSFCTFINSIDYSKVSVIENFYKWWNPEKETGRISI